jgi:hypothetical protein
MSLFNPMPSRHGSSHQRYYHESLACVEMMYSNSLAGETQVVTSVMAAYHSFTVSKSLEVLGAILIMARVALSRLFSLVAHVALCKVYHYMIASAHASS